MHIFNKVYNVSRYRKMNFRWISSIGAKVVFDELVSKKVEWVFGYPGGAILPVLNEFAEQKKN